VITLDPDTVVPMYVQLADVLRERIRTGEVPVGRRLPSMSELEAETGGAVSRRTIRSALDVLAREGLTQGVPGKGVYVVAQPGGTSAE
jgi:GntR family transcriptional regulator